MIFLIIAFLVALLSVTYFAANHGEAIHGMFKLIESSWKKEEEKDL